jgi:Anti-sigma factor NepR
MAEDGNKTRKIAKRKKVTDVMTHAHMAEPLASDLIGQRLRGFYDEIAKQPVPDRFLDLLKRLEAKDNPEETK